MSVMEQVKGVKLFMVPQDMMKTDKIKPPAVVVDGEVISQDGGPGNGRVSEEAMLKAVERHGAVILED